MSDNSSDAPDRDSLEEKRFADPDELAPPPLSEIGNDRPDPGEGPDDESESASGVGEETEALEDPERLRELQESLGRLEDFAAQSQAGEHHPGLRGGPGGLSALVQKI